MDNLAHSLLAVALAEAGLNRVLSASSGRLDYDLQGGESSGGRSRASGVGIPPSARAVTALLIVSSNIPDVDVLIRRDTLFFLEHHRGYTHTVWGVLLLGVVAAVLFAIGSPRIRAAPGTFRTKLGRLSAVSVLAAASHLLLDYTNSYGVRPFRPFSQQWLYGDLVSIVDPWTYLILGGSVFLATCRGKWRSTLWLAGMGLLSVVLVRFGRGSTPDTLGLVRPVWFICVAGLWGGLWLARESGGNFRRRAARCGLFLMVLYYGVCAWAHSRAMARLEQAEVLEPGPPGSQHQVAALPMPGSPLYWNYVVDRGDAYRTGITRLGGPERGQEQLIFKNLDGEAVRRALKTCSGQVMARFARFPAWEAERDGDGTVVFLGDVRFGGRPARRGFASVAIYLDASGSERPDTAPVCPWSEALD